MGQLWHKKWQRQNHRTRFTKKCHRLLQIEEDFMFCYP